MKPEREPIGEDEDYELRGDGSIDPMEAAEDDLNPSPTDPDDPKTQEQQEKVEEQLDGLT